MPTSPQIQPAPVEYLNAAQMLVPAPADISQATIEAWLRYHAVLALGAHAAARSCIENISRQRTVFSSPTLTVKIEAGVGEPVPVPDSVGLYLLLADSSTAAACVLATRINDDALARTLFELSTGQGHQDGMEVDWLAKLVDGFGVNPADVYPWFDGDDFTSARYGTSEVPTDA